MTEEQVKQKENLVNISKDLIVQNEAQIAELKALKTENDSQANSVIALIQQLEISNNTLSKQAGLLDETSDKVRVQSRALQELGGAYDQIQSKIDGNIEAIKRGTGDLAQIQRQAKETIDLTQKQLEAGVITTEQAIANLQLIASNTKLTYEEQLAAQKAIFDALTKDVARFNETIKQAENERLIDLQQLLNKQLITEGEFNQRRSKLTTDRIKAELEAESDRLSQIQSLDLSEEEKQEETRKAIAKTTELQLQLLQQEKAERESIVALVREREELISSAVRRETSEIVSGLKLQQDEYGKINQALERQKTASDVIIRNLETENRLINSIAEVEQARRNLIDVESNVESDRITKVISLREKLKNTAFEDVKQRREIVQELQRLDGFSSRSSKDLQADLKRLEEDRFSRQIEAQKAEEKRARVLLELELKKNEAAAARAVIEAKIAENQAKQAVLSARSAANQSFDSVSAAETSLIVATEGGDEEEIANAQDALRVANEEYQRRLEAVALSSESVKLAADNVVEAQKQVNVTADIAENSRLALSLQQQAANVQLEAEARARGQADELERGANQAVRMATALNSIQSGIGIVDGQLVTVEGRREGGAMEANKPYVVGEGAGGRFLPGISEIIVPNTDSFAIASSKATEIFNQGTQNQVTNNNFVSSPVIQSNRQLLNAVNGLRSDIQSLPREGNKVEAQIINQWQQPEDKRAGMEFARQLLDELDRQIM